MITLTDGLLMYALPGLVTLFILIQLAKRSEEDYVDITHHLGQVVLLSLFGWPYVLVVWVFSWGLWLKPLYKPAP